MAKPRATPLLDCSGRTSAFHLCGGSGRLLFGRSPCVNPESLPRARARARASEIPHFRRPLPRAARVFASRTLFSPPAFPHPLDWPLRPARGRGRCMASRSGRGISDNSDTFFLSAGVRNPDGGTGIPPAPAGPDFRHFGQFGHPFFAPVGDFGQFRQGFPGERLKPCPTGSAPRPRGADRPRRPSGRRATAPRAGPSSPRRWDAGRCPPPPVRPAAPG
jgi:hypothetical protein